MSPHHMERAKEMAVCFGGNGLSTNQQIENATKLLERWAYDDGLPDYDLGRRLILIEGEIERVELKQEIKGHTSLGTPRIIPPEL